jgi:hypothetical protein
MQRVPRILADGAATTPNAARAASATLSMSQMLRRLPRSAYFLTFPNAGTGESRYDDCEAAISN